MTRREATLLLSALSAGAQEEPRQKMPPYSARSLSGVSYSKDSTHGKIVLIQHWATWCGYCRKDEPSVESVINDHAKQGLIVLAVNAGEPKAKVLEYLKEHKRSAQIVMAPDTDLRRFFDGAGLPAYILVDRDGMVAHMQAGAGGLPAFHEMMRIVKLRK
ncbi:MAG: TlpA family protein disulfide reductase [Acidobacteria bacterium]|nr:TlpA family protein disulfide reductase [Acidobacteriota bacterium]